MFLTGIQNIEEGKLVECINPVELLRKTGQEFLNLDFYFNKKNFFLVFKIGFSFGLNC